MGRRLGKTNVSVSNVTNDLIPDAPNARSLGSTGFPFKAIYVEDQVVTDDIVFSNPLTGVADNIGTLAATGTTQADAAAVATTVSRVTAADGTKGVKLPALATLPVGFEIQVINSSSVSALKVYSNAAGELINGTAGTTAFAVPAGNTIGFRKYDATNWYATATAAASTGDLTLTGNLTFATALKGVANNIGTLAAAGTSQADAAAVATSVARITGTTAANGIKLPALASVPTGFRIVLINTGTSVSKLYSNAAGELINGVAGTVAFITPGSAELTCTKYDATNWYVSQPGLTVDRVSQSNLAFSALKGATNAVGTLAAAGSTQADAAALTNTITQVTGASGTNGVKLPALSSVVDGFTMKIINSSTTLAHNVYSNAAGELISGQAGTTAIALAAKVTLTVTRYNSTNWYAEKSVTPY